jgi:uncharacterized protein (TIGR02246 family)
VNTFTLSAKIISTFALMVFAFITGSAPTDNETEQELTKIMRQWAEARMKGDAAFLEKLYAKEFLIIGADGMLVERDTDIGLFARKEIKPQSIEDDDLKVSVYCPDVAIMTGLETLEGTYKGNYGKGSLRFTNVFVRRDGRWQLISNQSTWVQKK